MIDIKHGDGGLSMIQAAYGNRLAETNKVFGPPSPISQEVTLPIIGSASAPRPDIVGRGSIPPIPNIVR